MPCPLLINPTPFGCIIIDIFDYVNQQFRHKKVQYQIYIRLVHRIKLKKIIFIRIVRDINFLKLFGKQKFFFGNKNIILFSHCVFAVEWRKSLGVCVCFFILPKRAYCSVSWFFRNLNGTVDFICKCRHTFIFIYRTTHKFSGTQMFLTVMRATYKDGMLRQVNLCCKVICQSAAGHQHISESNYCTRINW
jgi:hypothetical protein